MWELPEQWNSGAVTGNALRTDMAIRFHAFFGSFRYLPASLSVGFHFTSPQKKILRQQDS
jgi:hypothetical protein